MVRRCERQRRRRLLRHPDASRRGGSRRARRSVRRARGWRLPRAGIGASRVRRRGVPRHCRGVIERSRDQYRVALRSRRCARSAQSAPEADRRARLRRHVGAPRHPRVERRQALVARRRHSRGRASRRQGGNVSRPHRADAEGEGAPPTDGRPAPEGDAPLHVRAAQSVGRNGPADVQDQSNRQGGVAMKTTVRKRFAHAAFLVVALLSASAASAMADPALELHTNVPNSIPAGSSARINAVVQNVGDVPFSGELRFTDTFPVGVTPTAPSSIQGYGFVCQTVDQTVTCTVDVTGLFPGAQVYYGITAPVEPNASGTLVNTIEVSGAGATEVLTDQQAIAIGPPGPFGISEFSATVRDATRSPYAQAGGNPAAVTTSIHFPTAGKLVFRNPFFPSTAPVEQFKDIAVHAPAGLIGDPTATPVRCTGSQLAQPSPNAPHAEIPDCPTDSQVGVVRIARSDMVPLYNMVPPIGSPAAFGFTYQSVPVMLVARLRPSDNGIDIVARNASTSVPVHGAEVTLWGVPADRSHDTLRGVCLDGYLGNNGNVCPSTAPEAAFLRLPTSCSGPLHWGADAASYAHPATWVHAETTSPGIEGCDLNPFEPTLAIVPTAQAPHVPTGLDATVALPQDFGPRGIASADMRRATVVLPEGLTINPSSAGGLKACADAVLRLRQEGPSSCPDASKIGTVTLNTPLLDHELGGSIFLRTQNSDDPTSGELFRIAVEVRSDDDGIFIRLLGAVRADPTTGRLTTVFDDLPQLPFNSLQLHFKSGSRAPLSTPRTCGTHTVNAEFVSWGDAIVPGGSSFAIGACPAAEFSPTFRAGSENPVAGRSTPFNVSLSRDDGDDLFRTLTIDAPKGLLGKIKNVELCSNAEADAGTCSDASRIGSATTGAGVGPNPFFISGGKVFLTGPYRGAPYGLAVVVDAVAGPFRLGTAVVRAAIQIDGRTAQLTVVSERFPSILKGVPLNLRAVRIRIDEPNFMVNATNCSPQRVSGTATSIEGRSGSLGTRFEVGNCRNLRFSPRISMGVGARGHTGFRDSTPLVTTIRQAPGQSNLRRVKVAL